MYHKIIKQKPYCCVPACLSMILERKGLIYEPQEEIGYNLGLAVPVEYAKTFPKARNDPPSSGYGTEIQRDEYSINSYFKKKKYNLTEKYYFLDDIKKDVRIFLNKILKEDQDIIVCFNYNALYGKGGSWGHVSLIDSIETNKITLIDPDGGIRKIVLVDDLIKAIKLHGKKNRAGFWVVSAKDRS